MDEQVKGRIFDGKLLRRLLAYVMPYWPAATLALLLLLINSVLQVLGPLITKAAVDRYLVPVKFGPDLPFTHLLSNDPRTGLAELGLVYLAIIIVGMFLQFGQHYLMQWTGQHAMLSIRRVLMAHLQELDVAYFDRNPVGRLVTRVTNDVSTLNELFSSAVVAIIGDVLMITVVLIAMLKLDVGLTIVLLLAAPFVVLATVIFRRSVSRNYRRIRVAVAKINTYIQEQVSGISVVHLFNRQQRSEAEFEKINRSHVEAFKEVIFAYGWFYPVVEFIGMLAVAGLLGYGGYKIDQDEMTLGVLLAFFQYGMRFFRPIQDLSEKYNTIQSAVAAGDRVFGLLDTKPEIVAPPTPAPFPAGAAPVEFDHVWFAYKDEDWVLQDVSFRIEPGETLAIVGHTGAGKTTIISLLLRFYDVQRGAIRIGGVDLRDFDPRDLRHRFGVVLQDPHLFTGTIEGNIRLGTEWIEQEHLIAAAEQVNLMEYVESLPEGFSHPVRERGSGISTGQKQLISFARALARNPRYLILDEATSSVDTETEFRIREALANLVEGRTSIVIAHRLSTIQRADRILVMHHGKLREIGSHAELLAVRGIYYKLYQLQYRDQEVTVPDR